MIVVPHGKSGLDCTMLLDGHDTGTFTSVWRWHGSQSRFDRPLSGSRLRPTPPACSLSYDRLAPTMLHLSLYPHLLLRSGSIQIGSIKSGLGKNSSSCRRAASVFHSTERSWI